MRRVVILCGPPGAGKGTIARQLVQQFDLHWLSSGELLRAETKLDSPRGEEIAKHIDVGNLVGDKLIISLVKSEIERLPGEQPVLLDGFPRNLIQAEALADMSDEVGAEVRLVVALQVEKAESERRVLKRRSHEGRADDTLATLRRRMAHFERQTVPLYHFYQRRQQLREVDGTGSPEQVLDRIIPLIRQVLPGRGTRQQKEAS